MARSDRSKNTGIRSLLQVALGSAGPLALAFGMAFLFAPSNPASVFAQEDPSRKPAPVCGRWHRGAGESHPVDLGQVKAAYRTIAATLESRMAAVEAERQNLKARGWEHRFPACREPARRVERLAEPVVRLAGTRFYFASSDDPGRFKVPPPVEADPDTLVFLLGTRRVGDLEEVAKKLNRKVHLAAPDFAHALGVRCAGTRVLVSERGDEIQLYEGE